MAPAPLISPCFRLSLVSFTQNNLPVLLLAGGVAGIALLFIASEPDLAPASVTKTAPAPPDRGATIVVSSSPAQARACPATAGAIEYALHRGTTADRENAFYELLPRLMAGDPAAAGRLALAWEPGRRREELLREVVRLWAAADPGSLITWQTSLPDPADRALAAEAMTAQVAQTDPAGALELAWLLRVGLEDGRIERQAQLWTEEEPAAAIAWVRTQPTGNLRDRLLARIARVRARSNPTEATGLLLTYMSPGNERDEALLAVVGEWTRRNAANAAAGTGQFPGG
jgi:hypothetical protein